MTCLHSICSHTEHTYVQRKKQTNYKIVFCRYNITTYTFVVTVHLPPTHYFLSNTFYMTSFYKGSFGSIIANPNRHWKSDTLFRNPKSIVSLLWISVFGIRTMKLVLITAITYVQELLHITSVEDTGTDDNRDGKRDKLFLEESSRSQSSLTQNTITQTRPQETR